VQTASKKYLNLGDSLLNAINRCQDGLKCQDKPFSEQAAATHGVSAGPDNRLAASGIFSGLVEPQAFDCGLLLLVLSILWFSSMSVTAAWLAASLERQYLPVPLAQSLLIRLFARFVVLLFQEAVEILL